MAKNPKWYARGFILVTVAESRNSDYQHPRVSVVRPYSIALDAPVTLPTNYDHPTRDVETLITFEFQQNVGRGFDTGPIAPERSAAGSWCNLREDGQTSRPYAGHLDSPSIRVENYGVDLRGVDVKLKDIDRAIKALRAERAELGVSDAIDDDCTKLILALKRSFKLPVLLVVYRAFGKDPVGFPNPDFSSLDTARRLAVIDRHAAYPRPLAGEKHEGH